MESIDSKIMAFVGTKECAGLVTELSKYTDKLYAAVSDSYGRAPLPGGNITIISSKLDDDGIQRWIDRTGVEMLIDGTGDVPDESARILTKAEENDLEYLRLKRDFTLDRSIKICESRDEIISGLRYTSGIILTEGADMYVFLTENGIDKSRIIVMTEPDPDEMTSLIDAGCSRKQIISFGFNISSRFLLSVFEEIDVRYYIIGKNSRCMSEKSEALRHSDVNAFLDGIPEEETGITVREILQLIRERFGLR